MLDIFPLNALKFFDFPTTASFNRCVPAALDPIEVTVIPC